MRLCRLTLCVALLLPVWGMPFPAGAQTGTSALPKDYLRVAMSENHLFFNALLPRLMAGAGFDYVAQLRPFRKAVLALSQGKFDLIGPYPQRKVEQYLERSGVTPGLVQKIPIVIDIVPMFAVSMSTQHILRTSEAPGFRVGYLKGYATNPMFERPRPLQVSSLTQLSILLQVGRINAAILPKPLMDKLVSDNPQAGFHASPTPVYFEKTYLYTIRGKSTVQAIKRAFNTLISTDFYQKIRRNYSYEKSWQE